MKVLQMIAAGIICLCFGVFGQNLLKYGDFSRCDKNIFGECRSNGGRISLFTEEGIWNKCGKLEIAKLTTTKEGHEIAAAAVWIGGDARAAGFPAKPNTTYRFAVEIKGSAPKANVFAAEWVGDRLWPDFRQLKTTVGGIKVQKGWTRYTGTFKTGPRARRAALNLGIWHSTKYGPQVMKIGDYILFDNVSIEEYQPRIIAPKPEALKVKSIKAVCAPMVKTAPVVDGKLDDEIWKSCTPFDDFVLFKKSGTCGRKTWVRTLIHDGKVYVAVRCDEDGQVVAKVNQGNLWNDDVVEIFFGPRKKDRLMSQFAVSAGGGRFMGRGNGEIRNYDSWTAKTSVDDTGWSLEACISLTELGWTEPVKAGDWIGYNVCRQRKKAGENLTWNAMVQNFHEPENYGLLLIGDYGKALEKQYGVKDAKVKDRAAYEKEDARIRLQRLKAKYEALSKRVFTVAPVPGNGDFSIPFMPAEVFSPVESIALKAAVNEQKPLPVAIANLTDKVASYRVILETKGYYNGTYGLEGFPPAQITLREAVRYKDSDEDAGSLRLDPLPKMNQAFSIVVPPREAGLVWIDFDTTGVKPGIYEGRLRVIPLGETAKWTSINGSFHHRKYTGAMQDIPVRLEVRNIVLNRMPRASMGFFQNADSENMFKSMVELGTTNFSVSSWHFHFARDPKGDFDLNRNHKFLDFNRQTVRNHLAWGRNAGIKPTFFIGFACYYHFVGVNGLARKNPREGENLWAEWLTENGHSPELLKKWPGWLKGTNPQEVFRLWPQWVRGVCKLMTECGVPLEDFSLEVFDEAHPEWFPVVLKTHQLAKEAVPGVRLELTLGAKIMKASDMAQLAPVTDAWTLWRYGYFTQPEHVALLRKILAAGKEIRHYTCSGSMRAHLDKNFRQHAWFAESNNLTGNMFYIFNEFYSEYGAIDFKLAHDGAIVYRSFGEFIPSLRSMALRQGMTDVKYLDLLRERWGENPRVRDFLKTAGKRVTQDFAHDPAMSDKVREEAAELILEMQR